MAAKSQIEVIHYFFDRMTRLKNINVNWTWLATQCFLKPCQLLYPSFKQPTSNLPSITVKQLKLGFFQRGCWCRRRCSAPPCLTKLCNPEWLRSENMVPKRKPFSCICWYENYCWCSISANLLNISLSSCGFSGHFLFLFLRRVKKFIYFLIYFSSRILQRLCNSDVILTQKRC